MHFLKFFNFKFQDIFKLSKINVRNYVNHLDYYKKVLSDLEINIDYQKIFF